MMATPRLRPQQALLEQSRTVLGWLHGQAPEVFERPTVLPGWSVRQLAGHLVFGGSVGRPAHMIQMTDVSKHYGQLQVLKNVTFATSQLNKAFQL